MIEAERAVQVLRMAKASPSIEMREKFRCNSCLCPSCCSFAESSRTALLFFSGCMSSMVSGLWKWYDGGGGKDEDGGSD